MEDFTPFLSDEKGKRRGKGYNGRYQNYVVKRNIFTHYLEPYRVS